MDPSKTAKKVVSKAADLAQTDATGAVKLTLQAPFRPKQAKEDMTPQLKFTKIMESDAELAADLESEDPSRVSRAVDQIWYLVYPKLAAAYDEELEVSPRTPDETEPIRSPKRKAGTQYFTPHTSDRRQKRRTGEGPKVNSYFTPESYALIQDKIAKLGALFGRERRLSHVMQTYRRASTTFATHQEKRDLVRTFPEAVEQLISIVQMKKEGMMPSDRPPSLDEFVSRKGVRVIVAQARDVRGVRQRIIVDAQLSDEQKELVTSSVENMVLSGSRKPEIAWVNVAGEGWEVVGPEESAVVFIEGVNGERELRYVVQRDTVADLGIVDWLATVVAVEAKTRRNIRPTIYHQGEMAQFGLNAGPRHVRVFGQAVSIEGLRDYSSAEIYRKNMDAMSALSFVWNKVSKHMPQEVVECHLSDLESASLPPVSSQFLEEGNGYLVNLCGKDFVFPHGERTPPEGYLTNSYAACAHTDKCFTEWAFGFTATRQEGGFHDHGHPTRHNERAQGIPPFGLEYVDFESKLLVRAAPNSLSAFKPKHPHGSTFSHGIHQLGLSITSSTRVLEAFKKANDAYGIVRKTVQGVRGFSEDESEGDAAC